MTAFQALGPFISTFAEPDRTGLYYSKDGVLTIVDAPCSPDHSSSTDETTPDTELCNGKSDELSGDTSSSGRTSSSIPCDSVVPLCSTDTSLSAQEVPGISCHVGNYCTVIEVSPPTTTAPTLTTETSSEDSDSGNDTSTDMPPIDAAGNVENGSPSEDVISLSESEDKFDKSLTKEEREFNKLWYEAVYWSNDGAVEKCNINGEGSLENHFVGKSEDKSTLLSSITVNGINLSSSIALSGPISCDSIPMISCNNSLKESKNKQPSEELQHSACEDASDAIPSLTFFSQELSDSLAGISLEEDWGVSLEEDWGGSSLELKVNKVVPEKECAFNYFQYWQDPLPDIEIHADSLTGSGNEDSKGVW